MNKTKEFSPKDYAKYDLARRLYLEKIPLKEIAERVHISAQTLSNWKKRGAWQEQRNADMLSPKALYNKLLRQMDELIDQGDPRANADAMSKICKQLKELQKEPTIEETITAFSGLGDWIIARGKKLGVTKDFLQELTRVQDLYVRYMIENDNFINDPNHG